MSRFNNMNDDELKSFMQKNQPQPPQAEVNELNILKHKLNLKDKSRESNSVWLWVATGLAASFFMFQFVATNKIIPRVETPVTVVATSTEIVETPTTSPTKVAAVAEEEEEMNSSGFPTLDVGEDFLILAEN